MRDVQSAEQGLPLTRTARRIECAMEHGTSHLRTKIEDLAWYQYFLLDIACAYLAAIMALLWLMRKCCCGRRVTGKL